MSNFNNLHILFFDYLSQSLRRQVMVTFVIVLLLPMAIFLFILSNNSWEDTYKNNLVKHKLLAVSLVEPVKLRIASYQQALQSLDVLLQTSGLKEGKETQVLLNKFANATDEVVTITLQLNETGSLLTGTKKSFQSFSTSSGEKTSPVSLDYISMESKYHKYDNKNSISSVFESSTSNQPVVLIKHYIFDDNLNKQGTLFAEIGLGFMQKICGQITFGEKGHCAIVDNKGIVIAHPNSQWVSQSHNLSADKMVKRLKKSTAGSFEYFSSTINEDVIGGYAKVDPLNWGIMVLQPKAEIDSPLNNFISTMLSWVVSGFIIALLFAFIATRKITHSLSILTTKSKQLNMNSESFSLGKVPKSGPNEILVLWDNISTLQKKFQDSNAEVKSLRSTVNKDLRKVVVKLRQQNLTKASNKDLLTGITTKSCFKEELRKTLLTQKGEQVGVILVDVDDYMPLIARKGQDVGNFVITHVAKVLSDNIRSADMVARYNDTSCFAIYANNSTPESLQGTAGKLRSLVETSPVLWEGEVIYITLSIGVVNHVINSKLTVNSLMGHAKEALEMSKSEGENRISTYRYEGQVA